MGFLETLKNLFGGGPSVDYKELLSNGAVIIDVRTPQEFKQGHIKGSKNIPLQNIGNQVSNLNGKEVILVCKSGGRASQAKRFLIQNGITAHNAGAWQNLNQFKF